MRRLLLALILMPAPGLVCAETPLTAAEFEAYATGQTLAYTLNGVVYGTEQYKSGRKVVWAFTKEECRVGYWYVQDADICFVYEDPNDPQCWQFFTRPGGLWAKYSADPEGAPMSAVGSSAGPLSCAGPDVGA
mgnify:CR=1 FL=1